MTDKAGFRIERKQRDWSAIDNILFREIEMFSYFWCLKVILMVILSIWF